MSVAERLRAYRARRAARAALFAGAAGAAVAGAALGAWRLAAAWVALPVPAPAVALASAGACGLAVALWSRWRAPGLLDTARALDRERGTAEALATAVEWESRDDGFGPALARAAHAALDRHPVDRCDVPFDRRRVALVVALALVAPLAWRSPRAVAPEVSADLVAPEAVEAMLVPLDRLAREAERQALPRAAQEAREAAKMVDAWRARPPEKRAALEALSKRLERARSARPPAARGLARALSHALSQSALSREAAARAREGDMAAAAKALESALKEAAKRRRSLEEERQVERLVKQLAQALRDAAAPAGDDGLDEGESESGGLDRSAEDARMVERQGRDKALYELAEQLAKMDPKDLEKLAPKAAEALQAAQGMQTAQLDREALEKLVKALKDGKLKASGEGGQGGAGLSIAIKRPGSPEPGASPGPGGGSGKGDQSGKGGGEELTPFDRAALDGKPGPLAPPSAAETSGARSGIRGAPGAMTGAEVSRVRQAPQVTAGPWTAAPAGAARAQSPADENVEREAVPRRRQALVRQWFDNR